jgi:hypothetical protein
MVSLVLMSLIGEFKFLDLIPAEDFTLLNLTLFLDGDDKYLFLNFVKRML